MLVYGYKYTDALNLSHIQTNDKYSMYQMRL